MEQTSSMQIHTTQEKKSNVFVSGFVLSLIATAIIFGLFFFLLYSFNLFPFSETTISQYDLLAQIVPFAEHFFDVVKGEASFFYSYRLGGGIDIFGTVMYCLCSPFTFIFFLFGEGNVYYAASVMLPVKLSCIAIAAIVMMKVRFKDMHNFLVLPVALLYAFCGYSFVANTYINWMDFLIYLPFGVLAFDYMRKTGKIRWFVVVIAACIYTCFSIACFSMLISYPIFVLYGFSVVEKKERKAYLFQISLCYLCGILAALPIMVPSFMAYLKSGRNTGIFDSMWNDIWPDAYYRKYSYIFSDALFIVLIVIYFAKNRLDTKESRFLAAAGLLIMMPVLVDECCSLMNMGSYLSYSLRFGFLNAIYELVISCMVLEKFKFTGKTRFKLQAEKEKLLKQSEAVPVYCIQTQTKRLPVSASSQNSKTATKRRKNDVAIQLAVFIPFILLCAFACLLIYEIYCVVQDIDGVLVKVFSGLSDVFADFREASEGFSSSFAHSTGGLQGILVLFGIVAVIVSVGIILYKYRLLNVKAIYIGVALVLFAQVVFYSSQMVDGNIFWPIRYDYYSNIYEQVLEIEDESEYSYRIKDFGNDMSDNQAFITGMNTYSVFSSVIDRANYATNEVFGMDGSVNTLKGNGGTLLGDCLLGYKYYIYHSTNDSRLVRSYLQELGQAGDGEFILYKNELAFPSAFTVPSGNMGVETDFDSYMENMQNLYTFLGGEGDVFTTYEINKDDVFYTTVTDSVSGEEKEVIQVRVRLVETGDINFCSQLPLDKGIKYFTGPESYDNSWDFLGFKTYTYQERAYSSFYYMFLYSTDPNYKLTVEEVLEKSCVKIIKKDTVAALSEKLRDRACEYTLENTAWHTTFNLSATAQNEGDQLFLNYVNIKGMRAYVNGKEVDLVENGLNMIVVPLEKGDNEVKIVYTSPYPTYALAAGIFSLLAFGIIGFVLYKKKNWAQALYTPVAIASVTLSLAVVGFFMLFPTVVFIGKLIALIF